MFTKKELTENLKIYYEESKEVFDIFEFDGKKNTLKLSNVYIWFDKYTKQIILKSDFYYYRTDLKNFSVKKYKNKISIYFGEKSVDFNFENSIEMSSISIYNFIVNWVLLIEKTDYKNSL